MWVMRWLLRERLVRLMPNLGPPGAVHQAPCTDRAGGLGALQRHGHHVLARPRTRGPRGGRRAGHRAGRRARAAPGLAFSLLPFWFRTSDAALSVSVLSLAGNGR